MNDTIDYDVIVVGARVAGSATAMQLARNGLRVLLVDRATFPSDTLSSHQLQVPGAARLKAWGLLDRLTQAGTPPTRGVTFATPDVSFSGRLPALDGVDAMYSPRRTLLDTVLVEAARDAGAEVCEGTIVAELVFDAGRVVGVRAKAKGSDAVVERRASVVVGADGKNSLVAKAVGAAATRRHSARTLAFYTYWDGVDLDGGHIRQRPTRLMGAWPTNDGLVITYFGWPAADFDEFRSDRDKAVRSTLEAMGDVGDRILAGRRAEPIRATTDVPNVVRTPYGPGWALAGDAGLVMDPITGQGIGHALRDADLLSAALVRGLGGGGLERALRDYERVRNRETRQMYDLTVGLASFPPPSAAQDAVFQAIAERSGEPDRFLSVLTGVTPPNAFFSPPHLVSLVGVRGFIRLARNRPRPT